MKSLKKVGGTEVWVWVTKKILVLQAEAEMRLQMKRSLGLDSLSSSSQEKIQEKEIENFLPFLCPQPGVLHPGTIIFYYNRPGRKERVKGWNFPTLLPPPLSPSSIHIRC